MENKLFVSLTYFTYLIVTNHYNFYFFLHLCKKTDLRDFKKKNDYFNFVLLDVIK